MALATDDTFCSEALLQITSSQWLETHSLKSKGLTLDQLLPKLGFRRREGQVPKTSEFVSSVYGEGCFLQHPDSSGRVYNVCVSENVLEAEERHLHEVIHLLQARLEWLNSRSRLLFGVMTLKQPVLVLDSSIQDPTRFQPFLSAAVSLAQEQLPSTHKFSLIRCFGGLDHFSEGLVETSPGTLSEAVEWLNKSAPLSLSIKNNVVEAVESAFHYQDADAVYLLTQGNSTLRAFNPLMEKLEQSSIPVYVCVYECTDHSAVEQYQELAEAANTRLHLYNKHVPVHPPNHSPPSSRPSSAKSTSSNFSQSSNSSKHKRATPSVPREDVLLVWEELEEARDTLAELQAIRLELREKADHSTRVPPTLPREDSMSSLQWLAVHGLKQSKLMFEDLVSSLAFQHCEGVMRQSDHHPDSSHMAVITTSKLVQARYCKNFVHMRWKDGRTLHVHLAERIFHNYRNAILQLTTTIHKRMEWLKRGSRELFGTVMENNVVVAVDTSSSMRGRLSLVKRRLLQLMEQQLRHKHSFNILQFSSDVVAWREHMAPVAAHNLSAARQWVLALEAGGSTNTLGVLKKALAMEEAEAVYLLTDGRPDQSPDVILGQLQQLKQLPVHAISFNCADSKANRFLSRLAAASGGRYHYYCEDAADPTGPATHQSDDLRLLEEEVKVAQQQLERATQLREECARLQQYGHQSQHKEHTIGAGRKSSTPKRPQRRKIRSLEAITSCKSWLQQNSLISRRLTLVDALGPVAVPHNPKHVPIIDKHVRGRVFEEVLSIAHLAGSGHLSLINPQGVDLVKYAEQLDGYITECELQLVRVVWNCLSHEQRVELRQELGMTEGELPSYTTHWEKLKEYLSSCGLAKGVEEDLQLLEKERSQAATYREQATALHREACRRSSDSNRWVEQGSSDQHSTSVSQSSLADGLINSTASLSVSHLSSLSQPWPVGKKAKLRQYLKGQQVIACNTDDGLYYPGAVISQPDTHHSVVRFQNGQEERVANKELVIADGSGPCPPLHVGDYVLARVRARKLAESDVYMPGVVSVLPENPRAALGFHSVTAVGGRSLVCSRRALVKISRIRYERVCAHFTTLLAIRKSSSAPKKPSPPPSHAEDDDDHSSSGCNEGSLQDGGEQDNSRELEGTDEDKATLPASNHSPTSSPPSSQSPKPLLVDQGTSPQPMMVDAVTITDPQMESVAVLTDPMMQDVAVEATWQDKENDENEKELSSASTPDGNVAATIVEDLEEKEEEEGRVKQDEEENDSGRLSISMLQKSSSSSPQQLTEQPVLARWLEDGWFYRSMLVGMTSDGECQVQDANGMVRTVPRQDIITDKDDAEQLLSVGDTVVACHPSYPHSYAPGHILGIILPDRLHFSVELYDGAKVMLPRQELYYITKERHQLVVQYIREIEQAWVGRAVIALRNSDGLYHPGVIVEQTGESQHMYTVRWSDGSTQQQFAKHMFGELTRRRPLRVGDYVITLPANGGEAGVCYPGQIMDVQGDKLFILLSDGSSTLASPEDCFWITREYYTTAVAP